MKLYNTPGNRSNCTPRCTVKESFSVDLCKQTRGGGGMYVYLFVLHFNENLGLSYAVIMNGAYKDTSAIWKTQ